jgi:hypothetical protein
MMKEMLMEEDEGEGERRYKSSLIIPQPPNSEAK